MAKAVDGMQQARDAQARIARDNQARWADKQQRDRDHQPDQKETVKVNDGKRKTERVKETRTAEQATKQQAVKEPAKQAETAPVSVNSSPSKPYVQHDFEMMPNDESVFARALNDAGKGATDKLNDRAERRMAEKETRQRTEVKTKEAEKENDLAK